MNSNVTGTGVQASRKPRTPRTPFADFGGQNEFWQTFLGKSNSRRQFIFLIFFVNLGRWRFKVGQIRGERHLLGWMRCILGDLLGRHFPPKKGTFADNLRYSLCLQLGWISTITYLLSPKPEVYSLRLIAHSK